MSRVITFGEIMLRLNPSGYLRLVQANSLEMNYAGGEANVAASLANLGINAAFVSKIPKHEVGECVVRELRKNGVDTNFILRGGERVGVFYLEKGASQRASKVIYDRANSAIALANPSEFDWDRIFEGADWFHWTGITPALSENMRICCMEACRAAKAKGITISCDLNYRKKLWLREKAGAYMTQLMPYVDVLIANEEDAQDVFGISASNTDISGGKLDHRAYIDVARQITERFGIKKVAFTLRTSLSATDNRWAGMFYENHEACFSKEYLIHIVDRVGGGDSFGAGLIYAQLNGLSQQQSIEFAVAASCLKQTIEHDFNLASIDEINALVGGNGSGRVQR